MNLIGAGALKAADGSSSLGAASQGNLLDWADKTFGQVRGFSFCCCL